MVGQQVEFPIDHGIYELGIVSTYCEDTGKVTVKDSEGTTWAGYEYQCVGVDENE